MKNASTSGNAPDFRTPSLVATALAPDDQGHMAHLVVSDHTCEEDLELVYIHRPGSGPRRS